MSWAPEPASLHASGISAEIEHVIAKALDKDPSGRYESAGALAEAFAAAVQELEAEDPSSRVLL